MPGSSPPTRRVVEIVELLVERGDVPARLSDIVKALGLNQATAHMIMKELVAAGWVTRDPVDKTFSVGGALARLAEQIDHSQSVVHAAHAVAQALADEYGYAVSVSERMGHQLAITAFIAAPTGHDDQWHAAVGDRLPFAAPFGPAYAAWEPREERLAWIERSGVASRAFRLHLEQFLDDTVRQGFSVESMSPEMVSAVPVMTKLQTEALSDSMRDNIDSVLLEMTGAATNPARPRGQRNYVGAISVPVFDHSDRVTHSISVHPFTNLTSRKIEQVGRRICRAAATIGAHCISPK